MRHSVLNEINTVIKDESNRKTVKCISEKCLAVDKV